MDHDSEQEEKEYRVRVYIVKHFDVTVKALNEEDAEEEGVQQAVNGEPCPKCRIEDEQCTWFYKGDCAVLYDATEVEEL